MADKKQVSTPVRQDEELTPGARLKETRKKLDKSLKAASEELHLDRWMLEAIERDDYAALGAPVFAKGHLRQYAKLLGIDADDLMVGYYQVCGSREQPPLLAESVLRAEGQTDRNMSWLWPVVMAIVVIGAIGLGIYYFMQPAEEPSVVGNQLDDSGAVTSNIEVDNSSSSDPTQLSLPPQQTTTDTGDSNLEGLLIPAAEADVPVPGDTDDDAAGSIVSQNLTITLRFSDQSWVEVYDANRQKLLYGMGETATVKYLSGPPPLSIFLGRQSGVTVELNGEPYEIPDEALRGNTARFQIEAPQ